MQNQANQFAMGQDMQTMAQGKGGEQQSWLKNRSGWGKVADIATMGLTAGMGSTGYGARRQANQQSQAQTDAYNQAGSRMNQRMMGQQPTMTWSHDEAEAAYGSADRIYKSIEHINIRRKL